MTFPRRGEIFLVDFDPTRGHGIKKTRPALVIQNDVIVAAISSRVSLVAYPVEVPIQPDQANGLMLPSAIHLDQIRSIDQTHLVKRLGVIDPATMRKVEDAIRISLGLVAI